jgi:predicted HAD superfamily Cof-like phosphohydrolase
MSHPDMYADVLAFHRRFGCAIGAVPGQPDEATALLRAELLAEEFNETLTAMGNEDVAGVADGLADLIYVALGTAIAYGIDLRPVWDAVHAANMAKVGGATRPDGKILKPAGWTPPDVAALLADLSALVHGAADESLDRTDTPSE